MQDSNYWHPKIVEDNGLYYIADYHFGTYGGHYTNRTISFDSKEQAISFVNGIMYDKEIL